MFKFYRYNGTLICKAFMKLGKNQKKDNTKSKNILYMVF